MGTVGSRSQITLQNLHVNNRTSVETAENYENEEEGSTGTHNDENLLFQPDSSASRIGEGEAKVTLENENSFPVFPNEKESPSKHASQEEIRHQVPHIPSSTVLEDENMKYTNDMDMDEIEKLEQTFDSLGIPSPSVSHLIEETSGSETNKDDSQVTPRWQDMARLGVGTPDLKKMNSGTVNPAGSRVSYSAVGGQIYLKVPTIPAASTENNGNSKSAPTSLTNTQKKPFSYSSTYGSEEWTYQKSAVAGFDPEKFKKFNRKEESAELTEQQTLPTSSTTDNMLQQYLRVPNYDQMEQQILESIEKEFVS